jgi:alkylation response protein AidB-like acyl-CoA dehydrogenase
VTVEALAEASASAALAVALHASVAPLLSSHDRGPAVRRGEVVGAIALSSDDVPELRDGRLSGTASWVAPLTSNGVAVVGVAGADGPMAAAVALDDAGVVQRPMTVSALAGLVCGHLSFDRAAFTPLGPVPPFMTRVRILLASAGLGMGRRALHEALRAATGRTGHGAGGEQTVQGLLADAATELDAARLLTWKAAVADSPSLVEASMAKLAVTEATQRAVQRATQVIGAESFRAGHVIERLARDVRALELFAGRTEALREAVALGTLPQI